MPEHDQHNTVENSGLNGNNTPSGTIVQNDLPSIAMIQNWIPNFDGVSAVTPEYFIETVNQLADKLLISDAQKILMIKTKIKGDALTRLINNSELSQEIDFKTFTTKFLAYFGQTQSLALRHQNLSACRQKPDEDIKNFAARLTKATRDFFGDVDIDKPEMKIVFNQTRLARLLESVLPQYRPQLLTKDVASFDEAIKYIQILQANQLILESPAINSIACNIPSPPSQNNTDQLRAEVINLAKEIANLHIQNNRVTEQLDNINESVANNNFMRGRRCNYCSRFNCTVHSESNFHGNQNPRASHPQERASRARFPPANRQVDHFPSYRGGSNNPPRYEGTRDRRWGRSAERRWSDGRREPSRGRQYQNHRWDYSPRRNNSFGNQRGMPRQNRSGSRPRRSLN